MLNMCQISSFMAAAEGPVAEFSGFANFEQTKRKSNLSMSFPKIVNQMGSFGQKRKNIFFRICRPILDIFGFTLLTILLLDSLAKLPELQTSTFKVFVFYFFLISRSTC